MPDNTSFENYQLTEKDHYRKIRQGNKDVSFSYLVNYIAADMDNRVLTIDIDDHFIKMCEKIGYEEMPQGLKHPYMPKAGEILVNPIGEQLIAFCESDLKELMKLPMQMNEIHEVLKSGTPEVEALLKKYRHKKVKPAVNKPTTAGELDIIYYENYEYLALLAPEVTCSCLYVNIFPPLVHTRGGDMLKTYFCYLLALQQEYQSLLDFCFNMDFYTKELDGITAVSRFGLYCQASEMSPDCSLSMSFRARVGFGDVLTPVRDKQAFEELKKNPAKALGSIKKREPNAFERKFGIDPLATELVRVMPVPILSSYKCQSLEEMLYLEFEKMLELDMRIKKCKNCGRYFILKGNYQTEYCDRVPKGETQNCQNIGAASKYAQKVKDNPALALFNKAYKRYHARMKVGSVKQDAFKKWKYGAVVMRDRCLDGEVTMAEFDEWINGYFN